MITAAAEPGTRLDSRVCRSGYLYHTGLGQPAADNTDRHQQRIYVLPGTWQGEFISLGQDPIGPFRTAPMKC